MPLEYFTEAAEILADALPSWWAHRDPNSELAAHLTTWAEAIDDLSVALEAIYADQTLTTATRTGLLAEWALLWGASNEQLPLDTETLRGYLQSRAEEDGSIESMARTLLALMDTATNNVGTELVFAADGSGLIFPAGGGGLIFFETTIQAQGGVTFPVDSSGLTFPVDGSGLLIPGGRLEVIERFSEYRIEVYVREILAYDRGAFARACDRFRPADCLPISITQVY